MSYRRKPVVVEAVQFSPQIWTETAVRPKWLDEAAQLGRVATPDDRTHVFAVGKSPVEVNDTDWIVREVDGQLYVFTHQIFELMYEPSA